MTHPLEYLSPRAKRILYWVLLAATFANSALLQWMAQDFQARTNAAGETFNIVQFEFAGTVEQVEAVKEAWGPEGSAAAVRQTWADFPFLVLYSTTIALGVLASVAGIANTSPWVRLARGIAWAQWLAALLDALENVAMLNSLNGEAAAPWPQVAYYCAAAKFAIVVAGILFVFVALPKRFRENR